mgnify:CR=1 FL=1
MAASERAELVAHETDRWLTGHQEFDDLDLVPALISEAEVCVKNRARLQHSHDAIFHWNFQKYSFKTSMLSLTECVWEFRTMHCGILINMPY